MNENDRHDAIIKQRDIQSLNIVIEQNIATLSGENVYFGFFSKKKKLFFNFFYGSFLYCVSNTRGERLKSGIELALNCCLLSCTIALINRIKVIRYALVQQ